jgi:hypothetical protein
MTREPTSLCVVQRVRSWSSWMARWPAQEPSDLQAILFDPPCSSHSRVNPVLTWGGALFQRPCMARRAARVSSWEGVSSHVSRDAGTHFSEASELLVSNSSGCTPDWLPFTDNSQTWDFRLQTPKVPEQRLIESWEPKDPSPARELRHMLTYLAVSSPRTRVVQGSAPAAPVILYQTQMEKKFRVTTLHSASAQYRQGRCNGATVSTPTPMWP